MPDRVTTEHEVAIKIGGRSFTGWDTISIEMAIDNCADGFSLSAAYDPDRADLAGVFRSAIYKPCVITIDDEPVLTGRVEKVAAKYDADDRAITVEGRSLTAPLVDCSIDGDLQFSPDGGSMLSQICRQICRPFGVIVRADNDAGPIEEARASYGQKAYDFLSSLASPRHVFLNSSYKGELVITWANSMINRPVVAALVEGHSPLIGVSTNNDGTLRFSRYKVASQADGIEDTVDVSVDPSVTTYRPLLSVEQDAVMSPDTQTAAQAKSMAKKLRSADRIRKDAFASSFSASATVTGWRAPNGQRWHERQMVTLYAPGAMCSREVRYIIAGISFKLSPDNGETCEMRLVLPELYAGAMPKVFPWD